ncbi:hypothetical protein FLL83_17625 [Vibrio cholerae]|nr:hypothetical protein FLL83_17625 [Vibrio cholerae]
MQLLCLSLVVMRCQPLRRALCIYRKLRVSTDKKPRDEKLIFRLKEGTGRISVAYDPLKNGLILPNTIDPNSVRVERTYERDSGKQKVLSSVQGFRNFAAFDIDTMLMQEYEYIISVDTNSRIINGKKVSVCTCYQVPGPVKKYIGTEGIPFTHLGSFVIFNPLIDINPELIGWHLVITNFLKTPFDDGEKMLAIIVDSEKDSLPKFNVRNKPYFLDFFLHKQLKFCYASDKDKDTLAGQMLKMCHNVSNQIFQIIYDRNEIMPDIMDGLGFCDGYFCVTGKNA